MLYPSPYLHACVQIIFLKYLLSLLPLFATLVLGGVWGCYGCILGYPKKNRVLQLFGLGELATQWLPKFSPRHPAFAVAADLSMVNGPLVMGRCAGRVAGKVVPGATHAFRGLFFLFRDDEATLRDFFVTAR